jgi:hypothetical protein
MVIENFLINSHFITSTRNSNCRTMTPHQIWMTWTTVGHLSHQQMILSNPSFLKLPLIAKADQKGTTLTPILTVKSFITVRHLDFALPLSVLPPPSLIKNK